MSEPIPDYAVPVDQPSETAIKHRRRMRGIATFFIVIGALGVVSGSLMLTGISDQYSWDYGVAMVIYGAGILVAGVMARNASRAAAVFIAVWIILFSIPLDQYSTPANIAKGIRSIAYLAASVVMAWSAFRYHALARREGFPLVGTPIIRWGGIPILVACASVVALGLWALQNPISTAVVSGKNIPDEHIEWMKEQKYLTAGETPLLFYSEGIASIAEGGNLLTTKYVGSWWREDGELSAYWFKHGEVCRVEEKSKGGIFEDAVYRLHGTGDENWVEIWLSTEDDRHKDFLTRMNYLNEQNMHPRYKEVCDSGEAIDWDAFAVANGIAPGLVSSEELPDAHREWLVKEKYLLEDERVELFYSHGRYGIDEGGVLLTDTYFGGWYQSRYELAGYWRKLGRICNIVELGADDDTSDAEYRVELPGDDWFKFRLPQQNGEDALFIDRLTEMNAAAQTPEHAEACASPDDSGENAGAEADASEL